MPTPSPPGDVMRPDSPTDRAAALALGALALVALMAREVARLHAHPGALVALLTDRVVPAAAALLGLATVTVAVRAVLVRWALRDRVLLEARPSEEHDPTPEQVRQLAAQLARVHHARRVRWLRPAGAVRLQLTVDPEGVARYLVAGPRGSRPGLEGALSAYPDVEIHQPATPAPPAAERRGRVVRCELVLARPSYEPLADRDEAGQLLGALATAMGRLNTGAGETATVALDVLVASPGRARRLRARLQRQADPDSGPPARLLDREGPRGSRGRASVARTVERRHDTRGLDRKLDPGEVLLEFQLLVRVRARTREGARGAMRNLLAAFDTLAAENHLRAVGLRLGGLGRFGSDAPWRRGAFDRKLASGRFAPRRKSIATSRELAGLLSPPTIACHADNVARTPGAIPAPPRGLTSYPSSSGEVVIPLGRVHDKMVGERLVGVSARDTFFSYMAGRSRYGKTETAIGQFVALARAGHGGLFIDPHADALAEIKTYLADDPNVAARVVEIDASDRASGQAAWNLFAARSPQQAAARVDAFVDALATTLGWDERNARALNLATQAAQALTELAVTSEPGLAPTIFQVPTLLSDDAFRDAALPRMSGPTREFFEQRFPRLPAEAVTAVTNLIDRLRASRQVAALLGRPVSTYDAARALREDLIVLACPGPGSTRDRLLANLLVYDVLHAARARASLAPEARRPFWVFLDELQTYDGPNLPALLEQSAKYGGRGFLFNQNPERLTSATWNAVSTNRSHLASTTVNARAARMIAAEWGTKPGPEVLTRLERYTYLASVTTRGQVTKPFLVHGVPASELHAEHHRPELVPGLEAEIDQTCGRVAIPDALVEVGEHDQRLRAHLQPTPGDEEAGGPHRIAPRPRSDEAGGER